MATLAIDLAQFNLNDVLNKIEHGDTVMLMQNGRSVAQITPTFNPNNQPVRMIGKWPAGLLKGVLHVPDDFDAPLDNDLLDRFEGK